MIIVCYAWEIQGINSAVINHTRSIFLVQTGGEMYASQFTS